MKECSNREEEEKRKKNRREKKRSIQILTIFCYDDNANSNADRVVEVALKQTIIR